MNFNNAGYVNLSGLRSSVDATEVLASNGANSNTVGFQARKVIFDDFMFKAGKINNQSHKIYLNNDPHTYLDTTPAKIEYTGNNLDLAIYEKGYFAVLTPQGIRYTKAGNFTIDADGFLVTPQGYQVLDDANGPINVGNAQDITIDPSGLIIADGQGVGNIALFDFENEQSLINIGENLMQGNNPFVMDNPKIKQGYLASSNVAPIDQITKLMKMQNNVSNMANIISSLDELERTSIKKFAE